MSALLPGEAHPWRRGLPVLVTEANAMGSIAVIRSLGRAGYPVHACSPHSDALGFHSNYASSFTVCPPYDQGCFADWLTEYTQQHGIRTIIPSEGMLVALRPRFAEFAHLFPFSPNAEKLYAGLSKFDLFELLSNDDTSAQHIPPTLLVPKPDLIPSLPDLQELGSPLYIKVDSCYRRGPSGGAVYKTNSAHEAQKLLLELAPGCKKFVIQGYVAGCGVGVFFLLWHGQLIAEFMHRRIHEVPHTGGVSSLRESWWHSQMRNDALNKLRLLEWQGVAMMEYRWDECSDQFYLMEMNGRFWGSLHLALYAGVDFPRLLVDAFHGHISKSSRQYPIGLRCRHTFPKEAEYVLSRVRDPKLPVRSRLWSIIEFFLLALDPRVRSDLLFPGDSRLYYINLKNFVRDVLKSVANRIRRKARRKSREEWAD